MQHTYDLIILGSGLAGSLAAFHIAKSGKNILVVSRDTLNNTQLSGGEICSRGLRQKSLHRTISDTGGKLCNKRMLGTYLKNIDISLTEIASLCAHKPSYLGIHINQGELLQRLSQRGPGVSHIQGNLEEIIITNGRFNSAIIETSNGKIRCSARAILLCVGGYANMFNQHDNVICRGENIFELLLRTGIEMQDLDLIMIHPFTKKIHSTLVQRACIKTDTLAGVIFSRLDGRKLHVTNQLLQSHNAHQNFETILRETNCENIVADGQLFEPSAHYSIGGIRVDHDFMTNIPGIFAFGECMRGISGMQRVGGISFSEIIGLAKSLSIRISKFLDTHPEQICSAISDTPIIKRDDLTPIPIQSFYSGDVSLFDFSENKRNSLFSRAVVLSRIKRKNNLVQRLGLHINMIYRAGALAIRYSVR